MPKIWSETIAAHRDAVRDATLDAAAALVAEHGLTGLTMSRVAQESGIGRATLYKYFPDLDSIVVAWHERQIARHLRELAEVGEAAAPADRLRAVLRAYAARARHDHGEGGELAAGLHRSEHAVRAHVQLLDYLSGLIREAVARGEVRGDVPAGELAVFCLNAVGAADRLASKAAVERLVGVTMDGLRGVESG
jgi:AcrR family transcriptional regulator